MSNLTVGVVFVTFLNILAFMATTAMADLSAGEGVVLYNCSGTILETYSSGNCQEVYVPNTATVSSQLPGSVKEVSESTGFFIIDVLSSVRAWVTDKINYVTAFVTAPYSLISAIPGLPEIFKGLIGLLWYGLTIFLWVAFIVGRDA